MRFMEIDKWLRYLKSVNHPHYKEWCDNHDNVIIFRVNKGMCWFDVFDQETINMHITPTFWPNKKERWFMTMFAKCLGAKIIQGYGDKEYVSAIAFDEGWLYNPEKSIFYRSI